VSYGSTMPNRFTEVPHRPVPPTGRRIAPVVAAADLFMGLMLSRPSGLSLRAAWVTPATLLLTGLYTPVSVVLAALLIQRGGWLWALCAAVLLVVGAGSAAVAAVGLSQRRGH
jgi:hypothetical protein